MENHVSKWHTQSLHSCFGICGEMTVTIKICQTRHGIRLKLKDRCGGDVGGAERFDWAHLEHGQPQQLDGSAQIWTSFSAGGLGGQSAHRQLQLLPAQRLPDVPQIIQTAGCSDGTRTERSGVAQSTALGSYSPVIGECKRWLVKQIDPC